MSAWKKQAIPLVFIEVAVQALNSDIEGDQRFNRIVQRVDKWLDACWQPLREKGGRIDYAYAEKITVAAAAEVQDILGVIWKDGMQSHAEIPSAMLAVAEDTRASMPKGVKPERLHAWHWLIVALFDLFLLFDPDISDDVGYKRGLRIAEAVMGAA